ncbi:MAG TPA: AbrB/MazE/SpoVT family DNA-binding domain-containing protein [Humisphaera sp.]|jgi:AbrB family looped-hinge helix DNA binding protein|nr:AbrB/MazE/SpoVT family DNA-binding domain-containing protein [Humisphaera sp.]
MSTVVLSDKFEVVLPPDVREALQLEAGETLRISVSEGHVELVPIRPIQSMRGFLRGMNAEIERDDEDRL